MFWKETTDVNGMLPVSDTDQNSIDNTPDIIIVMIKLLHVMFLMQINEFPFPNSPNECCT